MSKEKSAAILTVHRISDMTPKGRKDIIKWLESQIDNIKKYHKNPGFASRYTARYLYTDDENMASKRIIKTTIKGKSRKSS